MKIHSSLCALCVVFAIAPVRAQTLMRTMSGQTGETFGRVVRPAGDQDGDGRQDLLIGVPGFNGGRGAIQCLSGQFLATGIGPPILWTVTPLTINAGAGFGSSIAFVSDVTGNVEGDWVVGAPGFIPPSVGATTGAVFLIDGSTRNIVDFIFGPSNTRLGQVVVSIGDQDGDGKFDIAASDIAISPTSASFVRMIPATAFNGTHDFAHLPSWSINSNGWNDWGTALASDFDLDGDGKFDIAIGTPLAFGSGLVSVMKADPSFLPFSGVVGTQPGERLGQSIDGIQDFNGDGKPDFIIGAPHWSLVGNSEDGRAIVISGANILNGTGPFQLFEFREASDLFPTANHVGACVSSTADLNNDGVPDIMIGAPDWHTSFPFGPGKGAAFLYSGANGTKIGGVFGANNDHLGDALWGGFDDYDGDGFAEIAVGGPLSDNPTADCGVVKCYRLFPSAPGTYCTSKVNSLGCSPSMSWSGMASASSSASFLVTCSNVINKKPGLLFYSHKPDAAPFQGGFLCVKNPILRTGAQNSGGSATGSDCTGKFSFDFTPLIQGGSDPSLVAGAQLFCQYWSRDVPSPSGTSLSNALRFLINP